MAKQTNGRRLFNGEFLAIDLLRSMVGEMSTPVATDHPRSGSIPRSRIDAPSFTQVFPAGQPLRFGCPLCLDPLEALLISTDSQDRERVQGMLNRGMSFEQITQALTSG